jgi:hypothetical protein
MSSNDLCRNPCILIRILSWAPCQNPAPQTNVKRMTTNSQLPSLSREGWSWRECFWLKGVCTRACVRVCMRACACTRLHMRKREDRLSEGQPVTASEAASQWVIGNNHLAHWLASCAFLPPSSINNSSLYIFTAPYCTCVANMPYWGRKEIRWPVYRRSDHQD